MTKKRSEITLPYPFSAPVVTNETVNIREAIYDFIRTFAAPELPISDGHIIWANQNDIALPNDGNDIIIYQLLLNERVGTGVEEYDYRKDGKDIVRLTETVRSQIQIDCYAENSGNQTDGMEAMLRAQSLETVARSSQGVLFLKRLGIDLLYADGVKDLGTVNESGKYQPRWMLTLHIAYQSVIEISQAYFDRVHPVGIHEVDSEYPPKETD